VPTGVPLPADAALAPTLPPDLAAVTAAWPTLSAAIKAGILALVHAAQGDPNA
jgi:hypothetical protein